MSFKDKCRVCLLGGAEYKIFENSDYQHSIYSKFFECFKEKIENMEGYPENICESCNTTLDTVYKFVTKYKTSSNILQCALSVVEKKIDNKYSVGEFEIEIFKNEPLSDCDDFEWPYLEPQEQKPDISLIEIKAKLKNLKEININKKPKVRKSPCKTSRKALSVLGNMNRERSEKRKQKTKKLNEDPNLSLPVAEKEKLCDRCGEVFFNLTSHKKHMHYNTKIKCSLCPVVLSGERGLKRHILSIHSDKPFVCETCGKCYGLQKTLKKHIEGVHLKTKKEVYACKKCGKVYTSKMGVIVHDRNVHTGIKPAVCEDCGKSFACVGYLKEHQRLHTGATPYKCPVCDRGYAQKGNMRSHMKHNHRLADLSPELLKTKPSWFKYLKKP